MAQAPQTKAEKDRIEAVVEKATENLPAKLDVAATSPLEAQIGAAVRVIGIVIGALTAILGFVQTRDLAGLIVYVQSDGFILAVGLLIGGASFVWSQLRTRQKQKVFLKAADEADSIRLVSK